MSIYGELTQLREDVIELKKKHKYCVKILKGLMKMIDYTNQEVLKIVHVVESSNNTDESREKQELRVYNTELINVIENIEKFRI